MNISELVPAPTDCEAFLRSREKFVISASGCYVLTTFTNIVLYIGLADSLRRRMNNHLDSPEKTGETELGRAVLFHWIETLDTHKIERTWLNIHIQNEGRLPILNRLYSPTTT
jgi:hypothetical protein